MAGPRDGRASLDVRAARWSLNTSNPAKVADYRALMGRLGLSLVAVTHRDLPEIDADARQVLVHKASQFADDLVLVDDGALEVDGEDIGVHVRWRVGLLGSLAGRRARMRVGLGFRWSGEIHVVEGEVSGTLVAPRGEAPPGFSILPFFLPEGRAETLAERRDDAVNPRALALARLAAGDVVARVPPLTDWQGPWQPH